MSRLPTTEVQQPRELSLFTGAGGGVLASRLLGWRTVGYVEWDAFCQELLIERIRRGWLEDAPVFGDIDAFDGRPWRGLVDVVSAGFPCQPFSVAGRQQGSADHRNKWPETHRVIREVRPAFAFLENVAGLLANEYFGRVLGDLAELGYDAEWCTYSAQDVGAPHRRKRLWILAADAASSTLRNIPEWVERLASFSFDALVRDES